MAKERTPKEYVEVCLDMLAKARIEIISREPYLSRMLYTLVPVMKPGIGTLGVTKDMRLLVDPIRVVDDPELGSINARGIPDKLAGVVVHEIHHILRGLERMEALATVSPRLANIAADLAINGDLRRAKWPLPSWGVFPEKYGLDDHDTMEGYFTELLKQAQEAQQAQGADKEEDGGSKDPVDGDGDVCAGRCGSAAGNPVPGEEDSDDAGGSADQPTESEPGRTQVEIENALRATAQEAKEHFGNTRGTMPGWAEELVEMTKPKKDRNWSKELNQVVRRTSGVITAGHMDFSYARPARRSLVFGQIRPGEVAQQYEAAVAIDTSGSMSTAELVYAKQTVCNIMMQTGLEQVWLAQCDMRVVEEFHRVRLRDIPGMVMKGRGGTDFRPIFESLKKLRPKPDMIVVITDGEGPAPVDAPTGIQTIWVIVPSRSRRRPAEWGHLVICSNDNRVVDEFDL